MGRWGTTTGIAGPLEELEKVGRVQREPCRIEGDRRRLAGSAACVDPAMANPYILGTHGTRRSMQPMKDPKDSAIAQLNERSREIFRVIVENYMESGDPVGSRTISRTSNLTLSPATIRNVMADLEDAGLLFSPHTSAGRLPTDAGMRMFVHGLLEVGRLSEEERVSIESECAATGISPDQVLEQASQSLSGLSQHAGVVIAPKAEQGLKHVEFVSLSPGRALAVMVLDNGLVENRIIDLPMGIPSASLVEASNYLNARLADRTMEEARDLILGELEDDRAQLDALSRGIVEAGLAVWTGDDEKSPIETGALIVRGHAKLLEDVKAVEDLERIRRLFEILETKESLLKLLDLTNDATGVQIFIGAENELFSHTGCSMIISPYKNTEQKVVGAIGVIGPTRMNYARIIPMVDYTAKVVGRLIG